MQDAQLTIVIPVYNDAAGLEEILPRFLAQPLLRDGIARLLIVDDGSAEGVPMSCQEAGVSVLRLPANRGYGHALKQGIEAAQTPWVGIIDADGSYAPEDVLPLFEMMKRGFAMAVGRRTGALDEKRPGKALLRTCYLSLVNWCTPRGFVLADPNSGLRLFRRDFALAGLPFCCERFSFTTSLSLLFAANAWSIGYHDIKYHPRVGTSKIALLADAAHTALVIIDFLALFRPFKMLLLFALCWCLPSAMLVFLSGYFGSMALAIALFMATLSLGLGGFLTLMQIARLQLSRLTNPQCPLGRR